jgi:hypothetical protein
MPDLNAVRRDSFASAGLRIDSYIAAASATASLCEYPAAVPSAAFRGAPKRFVVEVTSDLRFAPDLAIWSSSASATSEEHPRRRDAQEFERFRQQLLAKFDAEPVEDGCIHAAETILERALKQHGADAERWIERLLAQQDASFAAAVIKCVGRLKSPGSQAWRLALLDRALAHSAAEIRDAAVQAAELWGDLQAIEVLRKHEQQEPWLRDYVERVVRDLSE